MWRYNSSRNCVNTFIYICNRVYIHLWIEKNCSNQWFKAIGNYIRDFENEIFPIQEVQLNQNFEAVKKKKKKIKIKILNYGRLLHTALTSLIGLHLLRCKKVAKLLTLSRMVGVVYRKYLCMSFRMDTVARLLLQQSKPDVFIRSSALRYTGWRKRCRTIA